MTMVDKLYQLLRNSRQTGCTTALIAGQAAINKLQRENSNINAPVIITVNASRQKYPGIIIDCNNADKFIGSRLPILVENEVIMRAIEELYQRMESVQNAIIERDRRIEILEGRLRHYE